MTDLTAMADYQVPRVLRALGVLRYGEALAAKYGVQAALVDSMLWSAQNIAGTARFHLTETTYY